MLAANTATDGASQQELIVIVNPSKRPADVGKLLALVQTSLDDDKAEDVVTIALQGKSSIADYMVIASGRSARHVGAIADHLLHKAKDAGYGKAQVEGLKSCDWVLIDVGDIIVHLFRPEVRAFYNLEKMWSVDMEEPESMAV